LLLGGGGIKSKKFPVVFKSDGKNKNKNKAKSVLDKIDFGFWYNSKTKYDRLVGT